MGCRPRMPAGIRRRLPDIARTGWPGRVMTRCAGWARDRAERQDRGGRSIRAGHPGRRWEEAGGGRKAPDVSGRQDGEMMSAAALAVGPGGVELGSPGSPQGASPRQGPVSSLVSRREGTGIDAGVRWREAEERPQQHDSPRQREAHLQSRAWDSASKRGFAIASPRAISPRPSSAAASTSRRLLGTDRVCARLGCMPCGGRRGGGGRRLHPGSDPIRPMVEGERCPVKGVPDPARFGSLTSAAPDPYTGPDHSKGVRPMGRTGSR